MSPVPGKVLVLTNSDDDTAQVVVTELKSRGHCVLQFDPASFPQEARITSQLDDEGRWQVLISDPSTTIPFEDISAVWLRRPGAFQFPPTLTPAEHRFANLEAQMAIGGLLRTLDCLWVNHPDKLISSQYKPLQLQLAAEVGFQVPRSMITNDRDAALQFFSDCDRQIIYKPLSSGYLPASDDVSSSYGIYTSVVEYDHLQSADSIGTTACLFQEYVPKATELRITVIGNEVFPVEIHSQHWPGSAVDWRKDYSQLRYGIFQLPRDIRKMCLDLTRRLGLVFAAMDLVVTPKREFVFLEVNPSGQWAWLEPETGLPMIEAMADLLSGATRNRQA